MQIVSEAVKKGAAAQDGMSLVEVGPRVCLQPIKIFAGSFGGPVLYENPAYVSPNKVRHSLRQPQLAACAGCPLDGLSKWQWHCSRFEGVCGC